MSRRKSSDKPSIKKLKFKLSDGIQDHDWNKVRPSDTAGHQLRQYRKLSAGIKANKARGTRHRCVSEGARKAVTVSAMSRVANTISKKYS